MILIFSSDDLKLADRVVDSLEGIELENLVSLPRSMVGLNC